MIRQIITLPLRSDPAGSGAWQAPRGDRKHNGIDFVCFPGSLVLSPVDGRVTKRGIAYSDDHSWRYVQITDEAGLRHRLFYVDPQVSVGTRVVVGEELGTAQDITMRYPGSKMDAHIHYEIKDRRGRYRNPDNLEEIA